MELKTVKLPYLNEPTIIYFLSDIHMGSANMQEQAFSKAVKMIAADKAYWVGLGDYVDAINHKDPRFNPSEISKRFNISDLADLPNKQVRALAEILSPIAGKCLGLIAGNHEDAYKRHNGFDVNAMLCELLKADNLKQKAFIAVTHERYCNSKDKYPKAVTHTLCVCHGAGGGGMREGYPVNKTYDVFRYDIADAHIQGHMHKMTTDRAMYTSYDHRRIRKIQSWYASNGCFMSKSEIGSDGYFEQKPGKESDIGMLKLTIMPDRLLKENSVFTMDKIYF